MLVSLRLCQAKTIQTVRKMKARQSTLNAVLDLEKNQESKTFGKEEARRCILYNEESRCLLYIGNPFYSGMKNYVLC